MRCPKCKSYNHDKANFCIKCGSSLNIEQKVKNKKFNIYFLTFAAVISFCIFLVFLIFISQSEYKQKSIETGESISRLKTYEPKPSNKNPILSDNYKRIQEKPIQETNRDRLFAQAIKLKDIDPLKSLILFIDAYTCNPSADIVNTPHRSIESTVRQVISRLHDMDEDKELVLILTPEVLNKIESINIFKDVILLTIENYGYARAIQFAETVKHQPFFSKPQINKSINSIILSLYCKWLSLQLDSNNINNALNIYEFAIDEFPKNPEIELFGVEIALVQGDWEKAESLLRSINIPELLLRRADVLKNRISDIKGNEGKTIIKFKPGIKHIPLLADLNGIFKQKFLLDTGASFVIIPTSATKTLNIKLGRDIPVRKVSTAGGVKEAKEVTLDSIRLGSCIVHNIKALVLDIPGQPNLGLLGLNFLRLFHVEMDSEKGILILKPK